METFRFGRYDYTDEEIIDQAIAAGKSDAVIDLLWSIPIEELLVQAEIEAELNPVDEDAGWDETSQLLAAASTLANEAD